MHRVAFTFTLKPGADPEEYRRRHDEIWPDMQETLRSAGVHNFSIYRHGRQMFAYLESEDPRRMAEALNSSEVNARWSASMEHLIDIEVDPAIGFPRLLPEMFHLD